MMNLHSHCIVTLKGINNSYVSSIATTGKLIIVGSSHKEILVWKRDELISGHDHDQQTTQKGNGAVKCLVVLADKLFSAHQDHKIRVWRIVDDCPLVTHLATLPTLTDRASKVLNPKNNVQIRRHKTQTWVHHVDTVSSLALSPDESLLYSVSWDRTLKVWKTTNYKCLESVMNAHDDAINAVVVSSNGNDHRVFTGSADKKIKVWENNVVSGRKHCLLQVAVLEKHHAAVNALAVSSDGSVLYSGDSYGLIVVWAKNVYGNSYMVAVGELVGHTKAILCFAIMGDLVCSGSADTSIRIWKEVDKYCYSCLLVLEGHRGPVKCLAAANTTGINNNIHDRTMIANSYVIYSGSLDCEMKVWQIFVSIPQV